MTKTSHILVDVTADFSHPRLMQVLMQVKAPRSPHTDTIDAVQSKLRMEKTACPETSMPLLSAQD